MMKKNSSSKKTPTDSFDRNTKSVIGLYEMLAQAQPNLIDEDGVPSDHPIVNLGTPSSSDE